MFRVRVQNHEGLIEKRLYGYIVSSLNNPNFGLSRILARISGESFSEKFPPGHSQNRPELQAKPFLSLQLHFIFKNLF